MIRAVLATALAITAALSIAVSAYVVGESRGREQALEIICRAAFLGEYVNGTCRF